MGEEVKEVVGSLGYERAQDLVGRYDLLEQISHQEKIDLAPLITPLEEFLDLEPVDLPVREEELVEARAEAGLVRAKPIRMEPKQASTEIAKLADKVFDGSCVTAEFPRPTDAHDRVLGTELSGAIARARIYEGAPEGSQNDELAQLTFNGGSVAGQGFGAFNEWGVTCRVEGGAQDGVGKTMLGGTVSILKGRNAEGKRVNGSVGKSFAYGPSEAGSSCRDRRTPGSASASRGRMSCSPASRRSRSTTRRAASSTGPTRRASRSST